MSPDMDLFGLRRSYYRWAIGDEIGIMGARNLNLPGRKRRHARGEGLHPACYVQAAA